MSQLGGKRLSKRGFQLRKCDKKMKKNEKNICVFKMSDDFALNYKNKSKRKKWFSKNYYGKQLNWSERYLKIFDKEKCPESLSSTV